MLKSITAAMAAFALLASAHSCFAASSSVDFNAVDAKGIGKSLGTAILSESSEGLTIKVDLSGMTDGEHGFHVHEKGNCGPSLKGGKMTAANAAGPHYDPDASKSHKGPDGARHKGDLPKLVANDCMIKQTIEMKQLKPSDVRGRSLMIHEGGDNYSDQPENGGGAGRIAYGVIAN